MKDHQAFIWRAGWQTKLVGLGRKKRSLRWSVGLKFISKLYTKGWGSGYNKLWADVASIAAALPYDMMLLTLKSVERKHTYLKIHHRDEPLKLRVRAPEQHLQTHVFFVSLLNSWIQVPSTTCNFASLVLQHQPLAVVLPLIATSQLVLQEKKSQLAHTYINVLYVVLSKYYYIPVLIEFGYRWNIPYLLINKRAGSPVILLSVIKQLMTFNKS